MKKPETALVAEIIDKLDNENRSTVTFLRQFILETNPEIGEHVKWNSPAFYFTGEMKAFDAKEYKRDILVINIHRGSILLVFPTGSKINDIAELKAVNYPDGRKIIKISDLEDAKAKQKSIEITILEWLSQVEKHSD